MLYTTYIINVFCIRICVYLCHEQQEYKTIGMPQVTVLPFFNIKTEAYHNKAGGARSRIQLYRVINELLFFFFFLLARLAQSTLFLSDHGIIYEEVTLKYIGSNV